MKRELKNALSVLALAAVVGCSTVYSAREVQKSVASKGLENSPAVPESKLDFRKHSLEQLVAFAMTNRPTVVSKTLAVRDARLALKALAADAPVLSQTPWSAPKISLSGAHKEESAGAYIDDGDWRTAGGASTGLSLELLVYDFGRYSAKASAQAEQVVAAELDLANEGASVFTAVSQGYFTFLESRALLEVAQTNAAQYAEHLARAAERQKAGEANRLDVLKARLDLSTARQKVVTASNLVATSGAALMQALGIDASRGTSETVFGTEPVAIDSVRRAFADTSFDVESAFAFARTNAPSLRVARARLRAASHSVDAAIADLYPSVSATASFNWTDPLWFFKWGFSSVQTIFQGFRKTTAVDRAVVALEDSASAVDRATQTLSVELETAVSNRDNSRAAVASARAAIRSARENLETVREQFALGTASRVELSEAIAAYSEARGTCLTAFYDGQRAEASLLAISGRAPVYREEVVHAK